MLVRSLIPLIFLVSALHAGGRPHWIFLENDSTATTVQLTTRGEQRLTRRGSGKFQRTRAVSESQLSQIQQAGFKIRHASRFLNAVSVEVEDESQLNRLQLLPFVQGISPVGGSPHTRIKETYEAVNLPKKAATGYGPSQGQNEMLNIPRLHQLGYDGSGVLVGVFDSGFNTEHPVFNDIDLLAQYDFVDQEADASGSGQSHGVSVLSILGGYASGELIGPAHQATFLLARTEDVSHESWAEEDNWVAALEWADSLGVDIITTSLNYFAEFDDPIQNYPPSALDGHTTIIARAANLAAERGILVVNSAGNEGPSASSIWSPSDSPHVLSVGAVDMQGNISGFSGRGPTYDGRIKPNVVAQGSYVYMASGVDGFTRGNGTSFSAPQIAGLAALLLQAQPQLTPDSVISLFQNFGNQAHAPNNTYGWGIPDLTGFFPDLRGGSIRNCLVYPNPGHSGEVRMVFPDDVSDLSSQAHLYDIRGRKIAALPLSQESARVILIMIPARLNLADQLLTISVKSPDKVFAGKFVFLNP